MNKAAHSSLQITDHDVLWHGPQVGPTPKIPLEIVRDPADASASAPEVPTITIGRIDGLATSVAELFSDAVAHHEMLAGETGEPFHLALQHEYRSGLKILDTLINEHDQFVDLEALMIVRDSLDHQLREIGDAFPLTRRRLQVLLHQISAVEKDFLTKEPRSA